MSQDSVTEWIYKMKDGDDAALAKIWRRYFVRLVGLVRKRLGQYHLRDRNAEDIAASAFESFWGGLHKFELQSRDDLWNLLAKIADRKSCTAITASNRKKRGGGRLVGESGIPGGQAIEDLGEQTPPPEFEMEFLDWLDQLFERLGDDTLRGVAAMRLDGLTVAEIADEQKCSTRTVERRLQAIRLNWWEEVGDHA
jgi:RNA polymerase sigma factor (sigma-70 family)